MNTNLITVQEYADRKGISARAVQKAISKGKIEAVEVPHPTFPGRTSFMIPCEPCEPCELNAPHANHDNQIEDPTPTIHLTTEEFIPIHKMGEAQLYAILMSEIDRRISEATSKSSEWAHLTADYNERRLVPDLFKLKGKRSERALRLWWQKWSESDQDMFSLIHQNTSSQRGRKVTEFEQQYLFKYCLANGKKPIGTVISALKSEAQLGYCESPSSPATLKRWMNDWIHTHQDEWAQARLGSKYVKDNIVKSIMRDASMIEVGDILVADGHTLAFDVISPLTGKPARLTLVLIFDWASRYPVGAALAMTESSEHVLTAIRNAILHLGMLPKFILFDNGKAFKSKLFHDKADDHDLEKEFAGIFPRLGIKAEFAEAYNARTKVIERFFRTMQDQFESFQKTFRGSGIADKPAYLSRNEKWAKKMFSGTPLQYDEALNLTYYYFRHVYGMKEHSGIQGQKPFEVFTNAERDPKRIINPTRLNFLMLKAERKHLRSEGIWLNKCRYWDAALVPYVGNPVIIRYDFSDLRWILVYDLRGELLCRAELREAKNAFIYLDMENPIAHQAVVAEIRENKRLQRDIEKKTTQRIKRAHRIVAGEMAAHASLKAEHMEQIQEHNPVFKQPPMLPPLQKKETVQDEISRLAAIAREAESPDHIIPVPELTETPTPSVIPASAGTQEDFTTAYNEKLKRRGIGF